MKFPLVTGLFLASLFLLSSTTYAAPPRCRYDLRVIKTPPELAADAMKISDSGVVAGTIHTSPVSGAFVDNGKRCSLFYLPVADSERWRLYVFGAFFQRNKALANHLVTSLRPYHTEMPETSLLSASGKISALPQLPESLQGSEILRILPSGALVTSVYYPGGSYGTFVARHACIAYPSQGGYQVTDLTPVAPWSTPLAANSLGDVVVKTDINILALYSGGEFTSLDTASVHSPYIHGLNSSRVAVGSATPIREVDELAMMWKDGKMTRISEIRSWAMAINDAGTIVGGYRGTDYSHRLPWRAFVSNASTLKFSDLTELICPHRALRSGAHVETANDISAAGVIVGRLVYPDHRPSRACVLTPRALTPRNKARGSK